jgi:hypothetical protein
MIQTAELLRVFQAHRGNASWCPAAAAVTWKDLHAARP